MPSNSDTLLRRSSKCRWLLSSLILFVGSGTLVSAYAGQGRGEAMQFAPYDYSPYQTEPSWAPPPQPRAQSTVPYNQPQQPPANVAPPMKRPYEMLSPTGRGYYPYGQQPYAGRAYPRSGGYGGYPSWGSMWPGNGGLGGMPWGGGSMPWGSPGRSSFGWPGGLPFGW